MKSCLTIPYNGVRFTFYPLDNEDFSIVSIAGYLYLEFWKQHDHSYGFAGFLFDKELLVYPRTYRSKKQMFGAVQFFLKEYLDDDIYFA